MSKKSAMLFLIPSLSFLTGGLLGLFGMWTATSKEIPEIVLKGTAILCGFTGIFAAWAWGRWVPKEWKHK